MMNNNIFVPVDQASLKQISFVMTGMKHFDIKSKSLLIKAATNLIVQKCAIDTKIN